MRAVETFTDDLVCVGKITAPHGIRGDVKVMSYLEDAATFEEYTSFAGPHGDPFTLKSARIVGADRLICTFKEVVDRTAAEKIADTLLYVPRHLLGTPEEGAFFYADLEGLPVFIPASETPVGHVITVHNFGASDVLELELEGGVSPEGVPLPKQRVYYPLTEVAVPVLDIEARRIEVLPEILNSLK